MFIVVLTSACPSSSCTSFGAAPLESRLLVNVCLSIQEVTLPNLRQQLAETTGIFKGKDRKALEKQIQQTETELAEKLDKIPDILKDDGYPDVQAFMKTYRKAEAIVTQYNQDLAEWEQAVKNGRKPAEKQHRPPERQSVRNRLRQLQEEGKQNDQPKQRKKSQDRDR